MVFDKIIDKLNNIGWVYGQYLEENKYSMYVTKKSIPLEDAIEAVEEAAEEYNNGWIYCSDKMPDEHESIFAKFKGTSNWHKGMFEKTSDDVNVTVEYADGIRATRTMHTIDGEWNIQGFVKCKVIAWQPLPEALKEDKVNE